MRVEEEGFSTAGFGLNVDDQKKQAGITQDEEPQPDDTELPPPTRNVLLKARPRVFAAFEVLTLVAVAAYAYWNPKQRPWPLQLSCASLDCFNVQAELHSSMDLSAEPCDDFYQYVCGRWAEGHSRYEDQFRYLEAKVYMKMNEKLREGFQYLPEPNKPLSTSDKAVLSYVACTEVLERGIDVPWLIDSLLFLGKDKPGHFLTTSGSKNASTEALVTLVSLAMDYDLDVLFQVAVTTEHTSESRSVLRLDHSASLLRWKRHRERYLTAESTARCVHQFVSVMSCDCDLEPGLAAALVAMDVQVTTKMAAYAATSAGRGTHFRFRDIPSTHAGAWLRAVRENLAAVKDGDEDNSDADKTEPTRRASATGRLRSRQPLNLTGDSVLYTTDPRLFGLVDEILTLHPESHVRFYVAFQVVRALAPFASYRLTQSLFSDDNATAVYLYVADACAAAASKLTSFALATFVFQDVLTARRVKLAHEQVNALRTETMASLSWLEPGDQKAARKRLSSLHSVVAWPKWFNSSDALDAYFAGLPDFRGYYVEVYLDSVKALRKREKARLLFPRDADASGVDNATGLLPEVPEEGAPIQGFRPSVRYSRWQDSLLISPGTLFEPVLFATDSDNQAVGDDGADNSTTAAASGVVVALALAGLGHLVAHELWHAALGERTAGTSPESDITLTAARVRRHACLTDVYKGAAGAGTATDAVASRITKAASENLADVAGLQVAYAVYAASSVHLGAAASKNETKMDNITEAGSWISRVTGFSERELFFIASCFKWCASVADDVVQGSLGFTPARLRCNVPAALTGGFAETFGCSNEHRMSRIAANYSCASPGEPLMPPVVTINEKDAYSVDTVQPTVP